MKILKKSIVLSVLFVCLGSFAQTTEANQKLQAISGTVFDPTGPIPGANVVVHGTTRGTQTDFDGFYRIEATPLDSLDFSYVGMIGKTLAVKQSLQINVILNEAPRIEENMRMPIIYNRRKNLTDDVVSYEELSRAPSSDSKQSIIERIPTLKIKDPAIASSFTSKNGLLLVIDGEVSSIKDFELIPKNEIVSAAWLRGQQGAALFGSNGLNGVIIISTKNGYPRYVDFPAPEFGTFTKKMLVFQGIATLNQHLRSPLPSKEIYANVIRL